MSVIFSETRNYAPVCGIISSLKIADAAQQQVCDDECWTSVC